MRFGFVSILIQRLSALLRRTRHWSWLLVGFVVVLSEIITLIMNSINSLIWWGRIDTDLLLIGTIDAFVASVLVGPIAVFLIRHAFNLEDINRQLQEQMAERLRTEQERRVLEERLQQAKKMEAVGLLAGGVAHDLNNILSGLVGYPDLLLMQLSADHPLRQPLGAIKESGLRAAAVVQDLLALARRGVRTETLLNPNDVVKKYLNSLESARLAAAHPGVVIDTCLAPDLCNIRGSAVHLGKALMNLITNACEAVAGAGRVVVVTENVRAEHLAQSDAIVAPGRYATISVCDNGEGILPEDLERIFEPFYTKKVMGRSGTGLGLAVVWGTVQDHGGFINVRSGAGQGTCFKIYLPVVDEDSRAEGLPEENAEHWQGRGETILVVDDEPQQRDLAQRILSHLGYVVQTAAGGQEALDHLKTRPADLVVLDMIMAPGMDGLDTYRGICRIRPGQKAIIASGFSENERVTQALALGAGPYLRKPYTVEGLGRAVRKVLDEPRP